MARRRSTILDCVDPNRLATEALLGGDDVETAVWKHLRALYDEYYKTPILDIANHRLKVEVLLYNLMETTGFMMRGTTEVR